LAHLPVSKTALICAVRQFCAPFEVQNQTQRFQRFRSAICLLDWRLFSLEFFFTLRRS
jgi:hypothetical protein